MLTQLSLTIGSSAGETPLTLDPQPVTIFVGPNNSGKSLLLRELEGFLGSANGPGAAQGTRHVLREAAVRPLSVAETESAVARGAPPTRVPTHPGAYGESEQTLVTKVKPVQTQGPIGTLNVEFRRVLGDPNWSAVNPLHAVSLFTVFLDGKTRLSLLDDVQAGSMRAPPTNHLSALFRSDASRDQIRTATHEAFGEYFVIDGVDMTQLRVKFATRAPIDPHEERGNDQRAMAFHDAARLIGEYSDGVKAYTGLVSAVMSGQFKLVLVDEPEAFLHPPLSRRLGRKLGELSAAQHGCVLAATHDADFLMGAVEAGSVHVVRLSRAAGVGTARLLSATTLDTLMRDPILRSAGVLRALFHSAAVVCEADADRVFYEEINGRLTDDAVTDGLFLNVQGKDTVRRVVGPLRVMGIPAAAILDLDVLKGNALELLLEECSVEIGDRAHVDAQLGTVRSEFGRLSASLDDDGAILLDAAARAELDTLLGQLRAYGVFVVPNGALETWLQVLGEDKDPKKTWLRRVLTVMGSDRTSPTFVRPGNNDVWQFIRQISLWTNDPHRKGIPV